MPEIRPTRTRKLFFGRSSRGSVRSSGSSRRISEIRSRLKPELRTLLQVGCTRGRGDANGPRKLHERGERTLHAPRASAHNAAASPSRRAETRMVSAATPPRGSGIRSGDARRNSRSIVLVLGGRHDCRSRAAEPTGHVLRCLLLTYRCFIVPARNRPSRSEAANAFSLRRQKSLMLEGRRHTEPRAAPKRAA
jgi:hypothetical protein